MKLECHPHNVAEPEWCEEGVPVQVNSVVDLKRRRQYNVSVSIYLWRRVKDYTQLALMFTVMCFVDQIILLPGITDLLQRIE